MRSIAAILLLVFSIVRMAAAQGTAPITLQGAWAPPTAGRATVGVAYMTVVNNGAAADRLMGAESAAAAKVELHMTTLDNGIARMRAVPSLQLPARQSVELRPGGLHLMLVDLKAPLTAGAEIRVTLRFEKAGLVEVAVPVANRAGR